MRFPTRVATAFAAIGFVLACLSGSASAFGRHPQHPGPVGTPAGHAVFVQTDNPAGNQVVAYSQAANGSLTQTAVYDTGGLGGILEGSVVDHLASQGSLTYDREAGLLYAVNAASNTISVFAVHGDHLALRQVLASGGSFPVSIAVDQRLVYVLNAEEGGSLQGFALHGDHLAPISESNRALGLNPTETPQFTHTPGEVSFSPDGSQLLVTTKANGSDIDVFRVGPFGRLSQTPVVNSEPGAVPFAMSFDQDGHLLVAEAGTNSLAAFGLGHGGVLSETESVPTGQEATCWVVAAGRYFYVSNAASASLSEFRGLGGGHLSLLGQTETDAGTVDATVSGDGHFLYVQGGATGALDEFAIGPHGSLSKFGSLGVPGAAGGEGIAAN